MRLVLGIMLLFQSVVYAESLELQIYANLVDIDFIHSPRWLEENEEGEFAVELAGLPSMVIHINITGKKSEKMDSSTKGHILNRQGSSYVFIDEESFYQNRMGTIYINY